MSDTAVIDAPPIADEIDRLFDLREKKRAAEATVEDLKALIEAKEFLLMAALEAQGLAGAKGRKASIGISESVVPQVEDWDVFYAFIHRNKAYELLERRASAGAFRERAASRKDKTVPGVVPFTKRKLTMRVNT